MGRDDVFRSQARIEALALIDELRDAVYGMPMCCDARHREGVK